MHRECVETYGVDTPGEPVVYATDSKNFHIFPNSMEITNEILQSEADLRLKVYNYFIEYCNNNKETFDVIKYDPDNPDKWTKLQMSKEENYKNKMIIDEIKGEITGEGLTNGWPAAWAFVDDSLKAMSSSIIDMTYSLDDAAANDVLFNSYSQETLVSTAMSKVYDRSLEGKVFIDKNKMEFSTMMTSK